MSTKSYFGSEEGSSKSLAKNLFDDDEESYLVKDFDGQIESNGCNDEKNDNDIPVNPIQYFVNISMINSCGQAIFDICLAQLREQILILTSGSSHGYGPHTNELLFHSKRKYSQHITPLGLKEIFVKAYLQRCFMVLTGEIIDEAFENFYATFQNLAEKYAFFFRLKYAYLYTNIDDHVNKITHEKALFLFLLDQLENNVTTFTSLDHILLKLCIFSTASLIGDDEIEYSIEMAKNIIVEASISLLGVLPSHVGDMINNFHIVDPSSYFNQHKLNKSKAEVLKNKSGKMFIKTESISSQAWKSIVLEGLVQLQTIIKLIDSSKSQSEHQISSQDSKRASRDSNDSETSVTKKPYIMWMRKLLTFVRAEVPLIGICIRISLLYTTLGSRYDVSMILLGSPPVFRGTSLMVHATEDTPLYDYTPVVPKGIQQHIHYYNMSRAQAIQILSGKPSGTFLVRPHETQRELYFLSFVGSKDEGVKHAIIRCETIGNDESNAYEANNQDKNANTYVYRCGKVGPCNSIEEVLRSIDQVLPSRLVFDTVFDDRELRANGVVPPGSKWSGSDPDQSVDPNANMWNSIRVKLGEILVTDDDVEQRDEDIPPNEIEGMDDNDIEEMEADNFADQEYKGSDNELDKEWTGSPLSPRVCSLHEGVLMTLAIRALYKQLTAQLDDLQQNLFFLFHNNLKSTETQCRGYVYWCRRIRLLLGSRMLRSFNDQTLSVVASSDSQCVDIAIEAYSSILSLLATFSLHSFRLLLDAIAPQVPFGMSVFPWMIETGTLHAEALVHHMCKRLPLRVIKFNGRGRGTSTEYALKCLDSVDVMNWFSAVTMQLNSKPPLLTLPSKVTDRNSVQSNVSEKSNSVANNSFTGMTFFLSSGMKLTSVNESDRVIGCDTGSVGFRYHNQISIQDQENIRLALSSEPYESYFCMNNQTPTFGSSSASNTPSSKGDFNLSVVVDKDYQSAVMPLSLKLVEAATPFTIALFRRSSEGIKKEPTTNTVTKSPKIYKVAVANMPTLPSHVQPSYDSSKCVQLAASPIEYITWLLEKNVLQSINRQADLAFQQSHLYYVYKDPWEVTMISDLSTLYERQKLGRYTYDAISAHSGSNAIAPIIEAYSNSQQQNDYQRKCNSSRVILQVSSENHFDLSNISTDMKTISTSIPTMTVESKDTKDRDSIVTKKRVEKPSTDSGIIEDDFGGDFKKLWESLRAEAWLVTVIGNTYESREREVRGLHDKTLDSMEPYQSCLSRYLYRNALFRRLGLPHRFTAMVQVDFFGLKEVKSSKEGYGFHNPISSIEVYAVIRLTGCAPLRKADGNSSGSYNGATSKFPWDGSVVTASRKADSVKSPNVQGFEYAWKDQANFRFPLPEGFITLSQNSAFYNSQPIGQQFEQGLFVPPSRLLITLYERSFFSDTKLGELTLPLSSLTEEKAFRDWLPLSSGKSAGGGAFTWFIHLQMQLHMPFMAVELPPTSNPESTLNLVQFDGSRKDTKNPSLTRRSSGRRVGLVNQMDDIT